MIVNIKQEVSKIAALYGLKYDQIIRDFREYKEARDYACKRLRDLGYTYDSIVFIMNCSSVKVVRDAIEKLNGK